MTELARARPVTFGFLILVGVGAALVALDPQARLWRHLLFPAHWPFSSLGDYLRALTPMMLHFGAAHAVFNALALWILGAPIEAALGGRRLLLILLVGGAASNTGQYLVQASNVFGGLSGAIYALCGYLLLWNRWAPTRAVVAVPEGLLWLSLLWLALGYTGALDLVVGGSVANTAHLVGLLSGMALAALTLTVAARRDA